MITPGSILVGYDGSTSSQQAVEWAAHEAAGRSRPLSVVHAVPITVAPDSGTHDVPLMQFLTDRAHAMAQEGVRRARAAAPGVNAHPVPYLGGPSRALVDSSRRAELVVVGTHGQEELTPGQLGSVARSVATHARCGVVVVGPPARRQSGGGQPHQGHLHRVELHRVEPHRVEPHRGPVVVGTDDSLGAEIALTEAADHAVTWGRPLHVVAAWQTPPEQDWARAYWPHDPGRTPEDAARAMAEGSLRRARDRVRQLHPSIAVTVEATDAAPAKALADAVRGLDASLLVVGARGRGGLQAMLLGAVTRRLVHTSPCPVLIAHGPALAPDIDHHAGSLTSTQIVSTPGAAPRRTSAPIA